MNKKQKETLESLKQRCNNDKDRLDLLEESVATGDVVIENDGGINCSNKYILEDRKLEVKSMSPKNTYLDINVGVVNLINLNSDFEVKYGDVVVEKLSRFIVDNIITSIKNNRTIEYWENIKLNYN